ncbi:MAG: hypothetical protein D6675_07200 [Gemmatimonadetes bacterium]|nr:MAG: hypothetical protein D6675_07200 [Gemmatimonadota bacterium]
MKSNMLLFIMLLWMFCLRLTPAESAEWRVQFADGRSDYPVQTVTINTVEYLALTDVALMYRASQRWYSDLGKMVLKLNRHTLRLTVDSPIVVIDQQSPVKMVYPVELRNGEVFVPVEFITDILADMTQTQLKWDKRTQTLKLAPTTTTISNLRFRVSRDRTIVEVLTSPEPEFSLDASYNGRLILVIPNGILDAGKISTDTPHGLVQRVLAYQTSGQAQIAFEVSPDAARFQAQPLTNRKGIQVEILKATARPKPASRPASPDLTLGASDLPQFGKIVIDPGHGGKDPGAIGPNGTQEKDITLAIARRLKTIIESRSNLDVILTREDDTFIGLGERTKIANSAKADLFISIHCNASHSPHAQGTETYFLSAARNDAEKEAEMRENQVIEFEVPKNSQPPSDILEMMLWNMAANEFHKESQDLMETVQNALQQKLKLPSRFKEGGRQAGFYVLRGTTMPAILVEAAFITNPQEERLLNTPEFQEKIAAGIYEGVVEFISRYKQADPWN